MVVMQQLVSRAYVLMNAAICPPNASDCSIQNCLPCFFWSRTMIEFPFIVFICQWLSKNQPRHWWEEQFLYLFSHIQRHDLYMTTNWVNHWIWRSDSPNWLMLFSLLSTYPPAGTPVQLLWCGTWLRNPVWTSMSSWTCSPKVLWRRRRSRSQTPLLNPKPNKWVPCRPQTQSL